MQKNRLNNAPWALFWYLTSSIIVGVFSLILINIYDRNTVRAATGIYETVNYQGRLLTGTGAVVPDGSYNIQFKIYQDGDGTLGGGDETLEWTETRDSSNKVLVKNGYFSVYLGSITPFGSSIDWNQDTLWLSVNVGGTGSPSWDGEMSPFTRFSSTPYALNTKYLAGLGSADFLQLAKGVQSDSSTTNASIFVNKTGATANILQLQKLGSDVFVVANDGAITASGTLSANSDVTLGDAATDGLTFSGEIRGASPLSFEGATNDDVRTTFVITDPTTNKTITFADATGTVLLHSMISGDATVDSAGVLTVQTGAISNSELANSSISLALGTSGSDINWGTSSVSLGGTATLNLPDASTTNRGLVTAGTQTFGGNKTFNNDLEVFGSSINLGNNSADLITATANLRASNSVTGTTGTTTGTGTNTTTLTLTADAFAVNDVVLIDNVGQDYYTRVTADPGTGTYTVSPAITFESGRTVTKYNIQNVGATQSDYSTLAGRFFQGYFLGGIVTGAGTTSLSDGLLYSSGALNINASAINFNANVDMANNLLLNIGNSGTDFTSSGGLNLADALTFGGDTNIYRSGANSLQTDDSFWVGGTFNVDPATGNILSSGNLTINGGTVSTSSATFNLANVSATTLNIGAVADSGGINFAGGYGSTGCSINGSNGNLSCNGSLALDSGVSATTGTFSGALAANGGITFDSAADTVGAFTLAGNIDANNNLILNIGNSGTDFTSGGGLTLAGAFTANGGASVLPSSSSTVGLTVTGRTSQTADIFRIVDEWGDNLLTVNSNVGFSVKSSDGFTSTNAFSVVRLNGTETIIVGVNTATPGLYTNSTSFDLINTNATTLNFGGAATTLNIGPGSTTATSVNIAGGSGATGCTVTGATGDLACTGAISTTSGNLLTSNLGLEFTESDTNPTCAAGDYKVYADTSEAKIKKCVNGVRSDVQGENDVVYMSDATDTTWADNNTTELWNGGTQPNFTPGHTGVEFLIMVTLRVTTDPGANETQPAARIDREIGSTADCADTNTVGGTFGISDSDSLNGDASSIETMTNVFVDNPATTSNVSYTVCTSADSVITGTNTENRIDFTIFPVNDAADLAEVYPTNDDSLKVGEVVSMDPSMVNGVARSSGAYNNQAIGVVSTAPALAIGGRSGEGSSGKPIALSGRVPVKISMENGPIKKGDMLTSASMPGAAMKATKAGPVIGIAMQDYDGQSGGAVMMFVIRSHFNGMALTDIVLKQDNQSSQEYSLAALDHFLSQGAQQLDGDFVSDVLTDRVTAGLEIITPRITTDEIALNTIKSAGSKGVKINSDVEINGTLKVDKIKANQIEGLHLEDTVINNDSEPAETNILDLSSVTFGTANVTLNLTVGGTINANGELTVAGLSTFNGESVFNNLTRFFGNTIFSGETNFEGRASFNNDSGGFVVIEPENTEARIKFEKPYSSTPVISLSIKNGQFVDYAYKDLDKEGFTIVLKEAPTTNIEFSWTAFDIKEARTVTQKLEGIFVENAQSN